MSDLTKWLPLFEKCPELKPEKLVYGPDGWQSPGGLRFTDESTNGIAAALIRDRAVWHLLSRQDWGMEIKPPSEPYDNFWSVCAGGHTSIHTDHTEALYLAVCKVLGIEP